MMKKILLLGLLVTAACDENSGRDKAKVEFYLQNEAELNAKFGLCDGGKYFSGPVEVSPECRDVFEAYARNEVRQVLPGVPSAEDFLKSEEAFDVGKKYCVDGRLYPMTSIQPFQTIPLQDPICQNFIVTMEQLQQQCIKKENKILGCLGLAEDLIRIRNYKDKK